MIHEELCKKLKFDYANKRYLHNPESVLENETHKFLCDLERQTDHQMSVRCTRSKKSQQKKRTCRIVNFAVLTDLSVKLKESEKRDKYLGLARELKETVEHESDGDTNCIRD